MNNFTTHKIRNKPPRKPLSPTTKRNILSLIGLVIVAFVAYQIALSALSALSGSKIVQFFSGFIGKDLVMDDEKHTNILLLGVGGEGHDGKDLTDTIIIASIDHTNNFAGFLSIPRDLYTDSSIGGSRINRLYEQGKSKWNSALSLDYTRKTLEDLFGLPIHYVIKGDFDGFKKVVDSLGGIDVYVAQEINDPFYPKDGTYDYEPFYLPQGLRHLDGKTALKYARSRKTSSDFDRSARQHEVLVAIKKKAESSSKLGKVSFIKNLYYSLDEHVETTMSMREMLSLADFASRWDSKNLSTATLNDDPALIGGFLYSPLRELYGGASVLLPAGDGFEYLQKYARLILYGPYKIKELPIVILNGTKIPGFAMKATSALSRFGIEVQRIANGRDQKLATTNWYLVSAEAQQLLDFLLPFFPAEVKKEVPIEYLQNPAYTGAQLILELGSDSQKTLSTLDIFKNVVVQPVTSISAGTSTEAVSGTTTQL